MTSEILDRPPPTPPEQDAAVAFLRAIGYFDDATDPQTHATVYRVQGDVLNLILRRKRRELGVKHG